MTSGRWFLHGWRVRYFMRELCFFRSWDLHQLTRTDPAPPRLVSTWDAEQAIRMNARTSEYFGERVIEKLYRAVTHRVDLPSFAPQDLERHMLSKVLDAVRSRQLVAVEVERPSPPQYSGAPEPPADPEPEPVQEQPRDRYLRLRLVGDTEPRARKDS